MKKVRARFAPSPTGLMHLGNIRTVLMNYIFVKKYDGTLVLRIEDTDEVRSDEKKVNAIVSDLKVVGLMYDEGPNKEGEKGPYFQSKRREIYQEFLQFFIDNNFVYRCFCTQEELKKKKEFQQKEGNPPRYDQTCLKLSSVKIKEKVDFGTKFIWRFKIYNDAVHTMQDLAKGKVTFEMKHYGDFAITRQDGSFTFVFANFVDDVHMKISHVIRGQDHLSNTAYQIAMYDALKIQIPIFWHLPIICNSDGSKMSKRDFGFSLQDLCNEGYFTESIINYLGIIGGSFKDEFQSLESLIKNIDFSNVSSGGNITFDKEKLRWLNHRWINILDLDEIVTRAKTLLKIKDSLKLKLQKLISVIRPEMYTLKDLVSYMDFYFNPKKYPLENLEKTIEKDVVKNIVVLLKNCVGVVKNGEDLINEIKLCSKKAEIPLRSFFMVLRHILTGTCQGLGIKELLRLFELEDIKSLIRNY
jgi:glutamyl-tRNA synthetase